MSKEFKRKTSEGSTDVQKPTIAFTDWFMLRLKGHGKLQAHHHDAILAFFKNNGLTEQESSDDYDSALKNFGF